MGVITDFDKCGLLLPFNEADESTSAQDWSPFTDPLVFSFSGGAKVDNAIGYSALLLNGSSAYLSLGAASIPTRLQIGAGDFYIRFKVKTYGTSTYMVCGNLNDVNGNGHFWVMLNSTFTGLHTVQFGVQGNTYKFGTAALDTAAEHEVELSRSGTNLRCFLDGTQLGSTQTLSNFTGTTSTDFLIGRAAVGGTYYYGNYSLRNLTIVKGAAGHTGTYTPASGSLIKTLSGNVKDDTGANTSRIVRAYPRNWPVRGYQATSDGGTGNFSISVPDVDGDYMVTALDDAAGTDYNDLIYGRVAAG